MEENLHSLVGAIISITVKIFQKEEFIMNKPYINLPNGYPGIVSLFVYDKDMAKHVSNMAQSLMRRESPLSVGEREMIAAYVSKLNQCDFCCGSHTACAMATGDPNLVRQIIEEDKDPGDILSDKMFYLLAVVRAVQSLDRKMIPIAIQASKDKGATDREIYDTVAITSMFSMCNRLVEGLGTTYEEKDLKEGGESLAKYGYLMSIRRFFGEVLPKMFKRE